MCMLFIKPKNFTLPQAYFDSLQHHNADGVAFYNLESSEYFKTLDYDIAKDYLIANHDQEIVTHFRFGTSGTSTEDQLHGWKILNDEYRFFHNGVMATFKGDTLLSDTQNFVKFVNNSKTMTIDHVIEYLERYETNSRFMIVKLSDNSVIIPNCAKWAKPITIEGSSVKFSNNYAIDYHLQEDDGHLKEALSFDFFNDDFEYTDAESDLMMEMDYISNNGSHKELIEFITVNPEIAALYIKEYV